MSEFESFLKRSKDAVNQLNQGNAHALINNEVKKIKKEKKISEEIVTTNYIEQFNHFLSNEKNKSQYFVGKLLNLDYSKASVLTNSQLVLDNNGVPKSSFLIASLNDFSQLQGIEHFLLLFVDNINKLEDNEESVVQIIKHYKSEKKIVPSENKNNTIFRNMEYMGLSCKIMGMFYRNSEKTFNFSSQVNLILSPENYSIFKPNKDIKNIISNYQSILNCVNNPSKYDIYPIGVFSETESDVFLNKDDNPEIYLDLNVFKAKRTAFFGKTRLGKSNTVKSIISLFLQNNSNKTTINTANKTSFVVFDENGEYANTNTQDNESLYDKYKATGVVKKYTLDKYKDGNLMLNFYMNPNKTMGLYRALMSKDKSTYIDVFLNTDFIDMSQAEKKYESLSEQYHVSKQDLFKLQIFWTILSKSNFKYTSNNTKSESNYFFEYINKLLINPFELESSIYKKLESVILNKDNEDKMLEYISDFKRYMYQDGDNLEIKFTKMCNLIELFSEIKTIYPDLIIEKENKREYLIYDGLLEMLNTTNKSGYKILRKFNDFHSEKSNNNVSNLLNDVCNEGVTALIDLSTTTNQEVKEYYAEKLVSDIFNNRVRAFISNKTLDLPSLIFHFEEAHNLFPVEGKKGSVYYKLAKEGAKYNIGIMYATQSPSNIFDELLTQTENFFIGYLSSPKEVSSLTSLSFAFSHLSQDILLMKKVGYQRVLTDNHRYPIPIQISKFN